MRFALIINKSGGTFRRLPLVPTVESIALALSSAGHQVEVKVVSRREVSAALLRAAERDDLDVVVAGGGDGTILTAILAGLGQASSSGAPPKPLGILPLGTLNLLARDLGLPLDPIKAAHAIAHAQPARIDLGEVNGHPFAIWASLGMHPWIVRRRDHLQRGGTPKWRAMALAALRALRRYPMVSVTLATEGQTTTLTTPLLVISNNAWREETPPLSRAALDSGELVAHVAKSSSRLSLIRLAFNALIGHWKIPALLDTFIAGEVNVTSRRRRLMVSLDGEVMVMRSPLIFRVRPKALTVLVPKGEAQ